MSTIASPRDPSTPAPRRMNSSQATGTPTSSRASLENPRSATSSPNLSALTSMATLPAPAGSTAGGPTGKRSNRAALREYYNLKKLPSSGASGPSGSGAATPTLEITDTDAFPEPGSSHYSEMPAGEMDSDSFDADAYVRRALAESSLAELLRTYTRVLGEIRALDAEKKALVYDNYSKLISATETIRKMRANMDPLNPMAATLDPAIAQIYAQASSIRDALRESVPPPEETKRREEASSRRRKTRQLALDVLETPERMRRLISEGKMDEARKEWELPRRLLETWKGKGLGGDDVAACLEEGEAALRGEDSSED